MGTMLTNTQLKLKDAATQMRLAIKHSDDVDIFRSCINSYISLGRSVTFIMQEESKDVPELAAWYREQMDNLKSNPVMFFFNEKRVHSIHRGIVKPDKRTVPIFDLKINGVEQAGKATMSVWRFDDIADYIPNDSGNVFRLCEQYFLILKVFVAEWLKKRRELE